MTEKKALRVPDYIEHMLGAIERIESYVHDQAAFERNTLVRDEIIGEAANKIQLADSTFAQRHPQLRLDLAYRMRNALIHDYDSGNLSTIWDTIQNDLPTLRRQLANV